MTTADLSELTNYCKEQSGGTLRLVFTYTDASGDVLYVREDIQRKHRESGFEPLHRAAWNVHETVSAEAPRIDTIGDYRATVHTFDDAFVVQFLRTEHEGVVLSFDQEIGRDLHEFLLECEGYL